MRRGARRGRRTPDMPVDRTQEAGEPSGAVPAELRELAMHGIGLAAAAGGVAHQVRNPLNAIVLQLALLADKIAGSAEVAGACAPHLAKLREQVARVDEVVRRIVDAADPAPGTGVEAARLLEAATALFAHEARSRHLALVVDAAAPGLRVRGPPARVERLWVGLLWRAVEAAGEAGGLRLAAERHGAEVGLAIEHRRPPRPGVLPWIASAAADGAGALGGRLEESEGGGTARTVLWLPVEAR